MRLAALGLLGVLAFAGALVPAAAAHAQQTCAPYAAGKKALLEKYGETPRWIGIGEGGAYVVEVYASGDGETWSLVRTDARGREGSSTGLRACLLLSGRDWQPEAHAVVLPGPSVGH